MKRIYIYESSSKGGCFVYAQYLAAEASKMGYEVELILPKKTKAEIQSELYKCKTILKNDKTEDLPKFLARIQFLYRQLVNPLIFLFYIWRKSSNAIVIWNDFEQLSAPFWTLFLRHKHHHVLILHDPDRDNYPPSKKYSEWCMSTIVKGMHLILYHSFLPKKKYYLDSNSSKYLSIQHGIYPSIETNKTLLDEVMERTRKYERWLILGNIREEKNYDKALEALVYFPDACLLIAGALSQQGVDIEKWKRKSRALNIEDRVFWDVRYLPEADFQAYIEASDIILLNYQTTFVSQSGILNSIAPFKKRFVYPLGESALSYTCELYRLGDQCLGEDVEFWRESIIQARTSSYESEWDAYIRDATWDNIIKSIVKSLH